MKIDFNQVKSYYDGKAGLITGLSQEINLHKVFDQHLEKKSGRTPDIPYGSLAQMMLINVADDHHPLSRLDEYFENVDLESLLGHPVNIGRLNDDKFGGFLDAMHEAGCEQIYSSIAYNAFKRYGIKVSNMNFDTTSKVMWGEYVTDEGTMGVIDISFGYSKQKRFDKKQFKFSLGTTNGICLDGQVLSGNLDDKTYNIKNLPRAKKIKDTYLEKNDDFFYIAVKAAFNKALENLDTLEVIEMPTSNPEKPSVYRVAEDTCEYHGVPLKMAICYSEKLKYHDVALTIVDKETRRRGRPSKDPEKIRYKYLFLLALILHAMSY